MLKIKCLSISLLILTLNSCSSQESQALLGNVYSFNGNCKISKESYINGFRIEEVSKDSLYVRFYLDKEMFLGVSMLYNKQLKEYNSKKEIPFYFRKVKSKKEIVLDFKTKDVVLLKYKDSFNEYENKTFRFKYKDSIIKERIRNPYYAEDGFILCKNHR